MKVEQIPLHLLTDFLNAEDFRQIAQVGKFFNEIIVSLKNQAIQYITQAEVFAEQNNHDMANYYFNKACTILFDFTANRSPLTHLLLAKIYLYGFKHAVALQLVANHIDHAMNRKKELTENESKFYELSRNVSLEYIVKKIEYVAQKRESLTENETFLLQLSQNISLKLAGVHISQAIGIVNSKRRKILTENLHLMGFADSLIMQFRQSGRPHWLQASDNLNAGNTEINDNQEYIKRLEAQKKLGEDNQKQYDDWLATKKIHWSFRGENLEKIAKIREINLAKMKQPTDKTTANLDPSPVKKLSF